MSREMEGPDRGTLLAELAEARAHHAVVLAELQEARERQAATAEILRVISESPIDVRRVFDRITETAKYVLRCETAVVLLCEGDRFYAASVMTPRGLATELSLRKLPVDVHANFPSRAIVAKSAVHLPDWSILDLPDHERRVQAELGVQSALYLPLMRKDCCIGVLALVGSRAHNFGPAEIAQAEAFRDQALIAIENARLFGETRAALEELRAAQDRLVQTEKLASLGQLTAGIAHEIKNPLNFVNNFSSLSMELVDELQDVLAPLALDAAARGQVEEISGLLKGNLEKVASHGRRADSIVRNMLLHSRGGSGERRRADVNGLVEESLVLAYHGARAKSADFHVTLERDYDAGAGEADVFPQEVTRVLLNLIGNGFDALRLKAGHEPRLRVATRDLGSAVEIRVRDNGTGIPDAVKKQMFEPFFTTKPAGEGTGLGLSLSHDIVVKQHGGRIEVATEPGAFTEFTVVLPREGGTRMP